MHLVVGLGNPGPEYADTRHNAGFSVLDVMAPRIGGRFRRGLFAQSETARGRLDGLPVLLVKPLTYMNLSGRVLPSLLRREGLGAGRVLVVYDDMDVPLGRLRLRASGGAGGHRGMASIIASLGTDAVARIRVGIGRPPEGVDAAMFVLSPVRVPERSRWAAAVQAAADAAETVIREGLEAAMGRYNAVAADTEGAGPH